MDAEDANASARGRRKKHPMPNMVITHEVAVAHDGSNRIAVSATVTDVDRRVRGSSHHR